LPYLGGAWSLFDSASEGSTMRANPHLCCLLLVLLGVATPFLPIPPAQPQQALADPASEMAPSDDDEHGVGDTPDRDGRQVTVEARRGKAYGAVRRGDGYDPDAEDGGRAGTLHPLQLANPDHDIAICEAGCNGPRGAIVYMRPKPPRPAP
jgi:hypothetical protein